jgi:hypothetical protein
MGIRPTGKLPLSLGQTERDSAALTCVRNAVCNPSFGVTVAIATESGRNMRGLTILLASVLSLQAAIDFDRDVQPILSDKCYHCHGPDAKTRKGDLRLDTREGATAKAIIPGQPAKSEFVARIRTTDPDDQMPPPDSQRSLSPAEIATLDQWISEGAEWGTHWAFTPPQRAQLPAVSDWARNPIDHFVAAKLKAANLEPEPEAPRRDLIRRLSLDLTGLPPTPAEIADFLADSQDGAYERVVERLLSSPHYGERMAWPWLDVARYADSNGYQGDRERSMWPWRDWVVDAFNRNMPFDEFTIWQLAGDLLPEASDEQTLATAFLRNHMINGEGGRIAEENRVEYIFDQLETVGTTWLALTFNCARCHDHKYDPLSQQDYYSLFAFFNRTRVNGGGGDPATAPVITVTPPEQAADLARRETEIEALKAERAARRTALDAEFASWLAEQTAAREGEPVWTPLLPHNVSAKHQTMSIDAEGRILASGPNPANDSYSIRTKAPATIAALRLDALRHPSMTNGGLGRSDSGNFVLTGFKLAIVNGDERTPLTIGGARASFEQGPLKITTAYDGNPGIGWAVWDGKPLDRDHWGIFHLREPALLGEGDELEIVMEHDSQHKHHNMGYFRFTAVDRIPEDAAPKIPTRADFLAQDKAYSSLDEQIKKLSAARDKLAKSGPKVMVMADDTERPTYVLERGLYNQRRHEVSAAVPAALAPLPAGAKADRLGLARWLMAPENPLTARVTINRLWAQVFGTGLVKTIENFGVQGERPAQQALLDWLAIEFRDSGWDIKHMMHLMVTSATYRQQSTVSPEKLERDPANRLLARGARHRMPSWMIRDQALAASGLLVPALGGPGVNAYQPLGVWAEMSFGKKRYSQDSGDMLHRRSLYSFWRRIVGPTMFFDASKRQVCEVKEIRTNTPLQALAVLNDPTYVEAARALALRVLAQPAEQRIAHAFELLLARPPSLAESAIANTAIQRLRGQYAVAPEAAKACIEVGQHRIPTDVDPVEVAVFANLCLSLMNLDETLSKE